MSREVWTLERGSEDYPECLVDLGSRAPERLYGVGDAARVTAIAPAAAVTIVGSRRAGAYGRAVARSLGEAAAQAGLTVVSGLALGCDSAAHEGALDAPGATVAVLGNGPDVPYPRSKAPLYERILASRGAVVAEREPGTQPQPHFFPARNRLMAALAGTTIIVEGTHRSGTQHTAREAGELGREVAAVPGPVNSPLSELPNQLLHDGAAVVRGPQDLLDLTVGVGVVAIASAGPPLDDQLRRVLAAVEAGATTGDAVAVAVGAPGGRVAIDLARLELMGCLATDAGGNLLRTTLGVSCGGRVDPAA